MKTYTKFLVNSFVKSFFNVFFVMISLVLILNILKEIEIIKERISVCEAEKTSDKHLDRLRVKLNQLLEQADK